MLWRSNDFADRARRRDVGSQSTDVRLWIDPSCPWAWQALTWLRDLRDREVVRLRYSLFSLELNASGTDLPYDEAAPTYGHAFTTLASARREGGDAAVEALLVALGGLRHERREQMSAELLRKAAADAGLSDLPDRALRASDLENEIVNEYLEARSMDVFGVPTLKIEDDKVVYGPIIAIGPRGADGIDLWEEVRRLSARPAFFELKRWPRDLRPGGRPVGPPSE
jgi:predicted DsbA family dithiol-disulfide isomerase